MFKYVYSLIHLIKRFLIKHSFLMLLKKLKYIITSGRAI